MFVSANLNAPGRRYVAVAAIDVEGANYRVYAHRFGNLEVERVTDGATAFFQGDDADQLRSEIETAEAQPDLYRPRALRCVLDAYDSVLQIEEA